MNIIDLNLTLSDRHRKDTKTKNLHQMVKILVNKWARLDSNQRPNDYESFALTTAPRAPLF